MGAIEFTPTLFYSYLNQKKLMGSRCKSGGHLHVPPRPICPDDMGEEMEWVEMSGQGQLAAFTVVYVPPSAMIAAGYDRKNPYCVGIVKLAEGPSISAQILGVDLQHPEQIKIGMPLHATFIERGEGDAHRTFLAFEPEKN